MDTGNSTQALSRLCLRGQESQGQGLLTGRPQQKAPKREPIPGLLYKYYAKVAEQITAFHVASRAVLGLFLFRQRRHLVPIAPPSVPAALCLSGCSAVTVPTSLQEQLCNSPVPRRQSVRELGIGALVLVKAFRFQLFSSPIVTAANRHSSPWHHVKNGSYMCVRVREWVGKWDPRQTQNRLPEINSRNSTPTGLTD